MNKLDSVVDYLKVFNNIETYKTPGQRTMAQAPLANELEPSPLRDEMLKGFDPSQETHEEYLQRINLERPFNAAHGGRIGFTLGGSDAYKRTTVYKKRLEAEKKGLTYDVKTKEFKSPKVTAVEGEASIKKINDWTKKWINKNAKNYGVREFDDFKKNLAKDWKKQLKVFEKDPKFRIYPNAILTTEEGLPFVKGLEIDKVTTPLQKNPTLGYEKIFYNKMLKDKAFNKKVTEYLKFVNLDKRFGSARDEMAAAGKIAVGPHGKGFAPGGSKLAYLKYAKFLDDDVIHFMGDVLNSRELWNNNPAALNIYSIMEKNLDPKLVKAYRTKLGGAYSSWENNLRAVSELAGYDFDKVLAAQYKEAEKMRKVFNVKSLPFEFQYAQDHLFGLAEAKHLGDPKIARQTLDNLVASTKEQNRYLGTKGFTQRRSKLMRNFKDASLEKKASITTELNKLSEDYVPGRLKYSVKKDGSLKIQNLQPEKTFKSRVKGYEKLAKAFPKNLQKTLFKTYQKAGIGKNCPVKKAEGGRIGFAAGSGYDNCMNNAIQEHNKNLQSKDISVKNAARAKQYGILKNANKIKGMKNLFQMGRKGLQTVTGTVGTVTGGWAGVALEAALEGLFYEHYRRAGYNDKQAQAETFFYKMMDPDRETGVWEGAEDLLKDELVGKRDEEGYLKSAQPHGESWFDVGADKYQTQKDALEAESAHNDKLNNELMMMRNNKLRTPTPPEVIEAKEQEINDSYDRLDELEITLKQGTPEQEAYARAEEKQKALQDRRSVEWEVKKGLLDGSIKRDGKSMEELVEEYERPDTYYKRKERQHRDEFLEYKQAKPRYRKDQPYAFRESEIEANIGPEEGMRLEWEKYFPRSVDDPRTTEQQKWDYIYNQGGFDLTDKIGIAGGVSKMAEGGIMNLKTKW